MNGEYVSAKRSSPFDSEGCWDPIHQYHADSQSLPYRGLLECGEDLKSIISFFQNYGAIGVEEDDGSQVLISIAKFLQEKWLFTFIAILSRSLQQPDKLRLAFLEVLSDLKSRFLAARSAHQRRSKSKMMAAWDPKQQSERPQSVSTIGSDAMYWQHCLECIRSSIGGPGVNKIGPAGAAPDRIDDDGVSEETLRQYMREAGMINAGGFTLVQHRLLKSYIKQEASDQTLVLGAQRLTMSVFRQKLSSLRPTFEYEGNQARLYFDCEEDLLASLYWVLGEDLATDHAPGRCQSCGDFLFGMDAKRTYCQKVSCRSRGRKKKTWIKHRETYNARKRAKRAEKRAAATAGRPDSADRTG